MEKSQTSTKAAKLVVLCLAILLLYVASQAYHIWHIRVRCSTGTLLRDVMEIIQAPMILSRMFAPFIGLIAALYLYAKDSRKVIAILFVAIMLICCIVSFPYIYRFIAFFMRH